MDDNIKIYFQISTSSGVPIYRQIIDQVKTLIATGRLPAGSFLPSVRQVARELEVNPMTVSKAYSLIEKEGVVKSVRGRGMCVDTATAARKDLAARQNDLRPLIKEVVTKAKQLSLDEEHVTKILEDTWEDMRDD